MSKFYFVQFDREVHGYLYKVETGEKWEAYDILQNQDLTDNGIPEDDRCELIDHWSEGVDRELVEASPSRLQSYGITVE